MGVNFFIESYNYNAPFVESVGELLWIDVGYTCFSPTIWGQALKDKQRMMMNADILFGADRCNNTVAE